MSKETFQCAVCGGIFTPTWDDSEAVQEFEENFPGYSVDDCDIVCDDCYNQIMKKIDADAKLPERNTEAIVISSNQWSPLVNPGFINWLLDKTSEADADE